MWGAAARYVLLAAVCSLLTAPTSAVENDFFRVGTVAGTDKVTGHAYQHMYHHVLHGKRLRPMKVLEIGLGCTMNSGHASIDLWQSYFHDLDLWLADIDTECAAKVQNLTKNSILIGDQSNEADLLRWVSTSGGQFDVIVDDGSHNPRHQLESFRVLFEHGLKPGGVYFIEDIESPSDRKIDDGKFDKDGLSRDRLAYWVYELMKFPRNSAVDIPTGLMMILCQREACALFKCPSDEPNCP
jgi:hypothetical protein